MKSRRETERTGMLFLVLAAVLVMTVMLWGGRTTALAASAANNYTMYFSFNSSRYAELAGNNYIYLTGCTDSTQIREVTCSSKKITASYDTKVSGDGLKKELDMSGKNSAVALSVKNKKRLKDNDKAQVTILLEEGGKEQTLTVNVVFKEVRFKNLFKGLKIKGKKRAVHILNRAKRHYRVAFEPKKAVKIKLMVKPGFRIKKIWYHYFRQSYLWAVSILSRKNGKKVPLKSKGGRLKYMTVLCEVTGGMPGGLTADQQKLYKVLNNFSLGNGLPPLQIKFVK